MILPRSVLPAAIIAVLIFGPDRSHAVLFFETDDPTFNTTAPTGDYAGSGWDLQGSFLGDFLGTPIAPEYFVTATHLVGSIGTPFVFRGVTYQTDSFTDDPESDLRIWHVTSAFPAYAPLYTGSDEVGKELVVFGRGTQRGQEVVMGGSVAGWMAGPADHVQRWGTNTVSRISSGVAGENNLLVANFSGNGTNPNESHLTIGDSGGGIFIRDSDDEWKLAGVNYAVSNSYNTSLLATSGNFSASLFNQTGFFSGENPPRTPVNGPGEFFATRISARIDFIESATVPEPTSGVLAGVAAGVLGFTRRRSTRRA